MMTTTDTRILVGEIVEEALTLTVEELCEACDVEHDRVAELVEQGLLDLQAGGELRLAGDSLRRARVALRLQRDLGVNAAGAVLVVELLERIAALEQRLRNR
jgi:chaperone modulatory protein CbpM